MTAPAVASSRRIPAGVFPDPGATADLPAWWGATDWVEVEVRDAVDAHRDVCREHHVEPDTVVAVARAHAAFADHRTGRDCRPTNARLVELARVSLSTVQRARRVLEALGLVHRLIQGRSIMTRSERLAAWRRGSSHRKIAAVFALCSRRARGAKTSTRKREVATWLPGARPNSVERDTPPGAGKVGSYLTLPSTRLRATTENEDGRSAAAHTGGTRRRAGRRADPGARRLAEDVGRRLRWLAGTPTSRMVPTLTRFARAGWTAKDVDRATGEQLTARGHRIPSRLDHPAAYLAFLLRDVDPADRPGALDELRADVERRQAAYERLLIHGAPCPHGRPAGDVPSPLRLLLACPACRAAAEPAGW